MSPNDNNPGVHRTQQQRLLDDATNRAIRTLIQGLGIDIVVSVAIVLAPIFSNATQWGDFDWSLITLLLFKSIAAAIFSYVMRRWMDRSKMRLTPLPPNPQPVPHEDTPDVQ